MKRIDELYQMIQSPGNECIEWPYAKTEGYGVVLADGRMQLAHRLALTSLRPPVDAKLDAAHGPCHNRACINPRHLSWKTREQNALDRERDGTANKGERNGVAKLSEGQVSAIRSKYATGQFTQSEVGAQFSICQSAVSAIVRRKRWSHISDLVDLGAAQ